MWEWLITPIDWTPLRQFITKIENFLVSIDGTPLQIILIIFSIGLFILICYSIGRSFISRIERGEE